MSMLKKDKNKVVKKGNKTIPKTVQQTLPYIEAYENGVMQLEPCVFSQLNEYDDISFKTTSDENQENIYEQYMKFLNSLNPKEDVSFYFVNTKEDEKNKLERISPIMRGDKYDDLRKEMSDMLRDKMSGSRNNIETKKYITLRIEDNSVDKAMQKFFTLGANLDASFRKISKKPLHTVDLAKRLEICHSIFNSDEKNYWFEHDAEGKVSIDYKKMAKQGLTTKDLIAPSVLKFNGSDFQIGERFGQAMSLDGIANWMNTNFLSDLCGMNFESSIGLHIQAIPQEEAIKLVHNRSVNITSEVMEKQKSALQSGYSPEFISVDLQNAKNQIDSLQEDMLNRDQRLFYFSLDLVHFAPDKDTLKEQTKMIKAIANKYMCTIRPAMMQQERCFISAIPFGLNRMHNSRLMTTESLGIFMPFDEITQFDDNGFYYGLNAINKSLIIYDRLKGQNYNGLILGTPGSGKSFSAKRTICSTLLNTNADVFIIDPDGEYGPVANAFDGTVIKIAPGNGVYINPLDLDIDTSADNEMNPLAMKTDFICGMLETMLGRGAQLTPAQRSIVDRCVQLIYRPYFEHLAEMPADETGKKPTIDRDSCPTLQNLFEALMTQKQSDAQYLGLVMEAYTNGTFDTFAHRTNVDTNNRLIIYDIKDIGSNLRELGLKVCMNDIWNKMVENKRSNKWTWFYIDEFHLLMSNPSTSEFLKTIWKRARKFLGVPTGITQNVEDLLQSPEARAIINNSSFIQMLNQSAMDRGALAELLHLSENDIEFITNAEAGHGLIYNGKQAIPFADDFPKNSKLYHIMSTKAGE